MRDIKFGLFILPPDVTAAQETARRAESDGFYSVSHNDHFYSPLGTPQSPQLECFTTLTAIAAVTDTIRLAPAVGVANFRTPPLLAKITSTLDLTSNGCRKQTLLGPECYSPPVAWRKPITRTRSPSPCFAVPISRFTSVSSFRLWAKVDRARARCCTFWPRSTNPMPERSTLRGTASIACLLSRGIFSATVISA